ncbi:hypothetical protein BCR34DRAFT_600751 [Clohesyomyces aquaticus]|uniref:J domain-containing protein n=1 Tax=Clohesyomyces aquaticus TaxID=1231657 RepID=A0A1Y1ZPL4_9PLEO|nr:hypothetical protein BCR34DRAFT_600751 [Clohesyomyces aquaticus]
MLTHYQALGISRWATIDEVKKAYRTVIVQSHPDKTRHLSDTDRAAGEKKSKDANNAYEILSDAMDQTADDFDDGPDEGTREEDLPRRRRKKKEELLRTARPGKLGFVLQDWQFEIQVSKKYNVVNKLPDNTSKNMHGITVNLGIQLERNLKWEKE